MRFSIPALQYFEEIIAPAFADIVPAGFPFQGTLNEFTIMDDVSSSRTIIDIRRHQNIMQRRDASCDIIYKKVFGATTRKISTDEIYGATSFCRNGFYVGCLKDWRANDPVFGQKILPYFQGAVNVDIASNSYFGDIDRVTSPSDEWSTAIFDGIFKWIKRYIAAGVIVSGQTIAIADGTNYSTTPADAYNLIKAMHEAQNVLMDSMLDSEKAFYVSKDIARGYENYLISIGTNADGYSLTTNGIKRLFYLGIEILVEDIWKPIINQIKGSAGHAAILTIRGNFIFATDKNYGEGADGKSGLEVWYNIDKMSWFYRIFMKAGTQIALPEHVVIALSSWT